MTPTEQTIFNQMREALLQIDQHIDLRMYHCAPPNVTLFDVVNKALAAAKEVPGPTIPDNSQNWRGMDGTTAFHLITRHADGWADVGKMMGEWLAANQAVQPQAQGEAIGTVTVVPDQGFSEVTWSKQLQLSAGRHSLYTHPQVSEPQAQGESLYEARFKRLVAMEASLAPEDRIAYYVRNPHELDRLIRLDGLAKEKL